MTNETGTMSNEEFGEWACTLDMEGQKEVTDALLDVIGHHRYKKHPASETFLGRTRYQIKAAYELKHPPAEENSSTTEKNLPHSLSISNQIEETTEPGDTYRKYKSTGLVFIVCNCGYNSGWVKMDSIDMNKLREKHIGNLISSEVSEEEEAKKFAEDTKDLWSCIKCKKDNVVPKVNESGFPLCPDCGEEVQGMF